MPDDSPIPSFRVELNIAANGRLVIPLVMREAMGLRNGGPVGARLSDGTVILEPRSVALRRARASVARYVPKGADLIGELIAERRSAAKNE